MKKEEAKVPIIRFKRVYKHSNAIVVGIPQEMREVLGIAKGSNVRLELAPGSRVIKMEVQA